MRNGQTYSSPLNNEFSEFRLSNFDCVTSNEFNYCSLGVWGRVPDPYHYYQSPQVKRFDIKYL